MLACTRYPNIPAPHDLTDKISASQVHVTQLRMQTKESEIFHFTLFLSFCLGKDNLWPPVKALLSQFSLICYPNSTPSSVLTQTNWPHWNNLFILWLLHHYFTCLACPLLNLYKAFGCCHNTFFAQFGWEMISPSITLRGTLPPHC